MVERSICIREVKGSMPFFSTRFHFAPVRTSDYIRMEYPAIAVATPLTAATLRNPVARGACASPLAIATPTTAAILHDIVPKWACAVIHLVVSIGTPLTAAIDMVTVVWYPVSVGTVTPIAITGTMVMISLHAVVATVGDSTRSAVVVAAA